VLCPGIPLDTPFKAGSFWAGCDAWSLGMALHLTAEREQKIGTLLLNIEVDWATLGVKDDEVYKVMLNIRLV
jgi:hypothetical protein